MQQDEEKVETKKDSNTQRNKNGKNSKDGMVNQKKQIQRWIHKSATPNQESSSDSEKASTNSTESSGVKPEGKSSNSTSGYKNYFELDNDAEPQPTKSTSSPSRSSKGQRTYKPKGSSASNNANTVREGVSIQSSPATPEDSQKKQQMEDQQKQREEWKQRRIKADQEKQRQKEKEKKNPEKNSSNVPKETDEGRKSNASRKSTKPSEGQNRGNPGNGGGSRRERERGGNRRAPASENSQQKEDKSALLYSLWQQSSSSPNNSQNSRSNSDSGKHGLLSRTPSLAHLNGMIFSPSASFDEGEIVLVPRTRGGFSYGKVVKQSPQMHCYFDHSFEHKTILTRVIYLNNGKTLYKDLPSLYIGKIPQNISENSSQKEVSSGSHGDERVVGERPSIKDLNSVVFSPQLSFAVDEMVLVPRSAGGLTYGKIYKETKQLCKIMQGSSPLDSHQLPAWRVIVSVNQDDPSDSNVTRKDLISACIGKVVFVTSNATAKPGQAVTISAFEEPPFHPHMGMRKESEMIDEMATDIPIEMKGGRQAIRHRSQRRDSPMKNKGSSDQSEDESSNSEVEEYDDISYDDLNNRFSDLISTQNNETEDFMWAPNPIINHKEQITAITSDLQKREEEAIQKKQQQKEAAAANNVSSPLPLTFQVSSNSATTAVDNSAVAPSSPLQIGGIIAVDKQDLLRQLMKTRDVKQNPKHRKHFIVIDGPNVARKHGKDTEISSEGILIALNYYNERGHDAIAFLPQHYVKRKHNVGVVTLNEYVPTATKIPLLLELIDQGKVVLTPPQDYDDSYCIEYAMKHDACIVSNDRYWDHIDNQTEKGERAKRRIKKWIRDHIISFTFVRDEFLPNPNFKFPPFKEEEEKNG